MVEAINQFDTNTFLWLNGKYLPWLDPVMIWITERNSWFPLYALLIGWVLYRYQKQALGLLVTIAAAVAIGDQVTSSILKPLFHRLRPCHTPDVEKIMHPVMECGGLYGFASSHAATTFALAASLWFLLGRRHPWLRWWFLWAAIVSYSRIYVAAHYPLDVLTGAGIGILSALLCATIYHYFQRRRATRTTRFVD